MDKASALDILRRALELPGVNRSVIARAVHADPSQVSRIAAGQFAKLDGHALRVCRYAQSLLQLHAARDRRATYSELERKLAHLAVTNPEAADAVAKLIDALAAV